MHKAACTYQSPTSKPSLLLQSTIVDNKKVKHGLTVNPSVTLTSYHGLSTANLSQARLRLSRSQNTSSTPTGGYVQGQTTSSFNVNDGSNQQGKTAHYQCVPPRH